MSPTVFCDGEYRYFFFSREETRMHIHVSCSKGEAKFWIEPKVALEKKYGINANELKKIQKTIEVRKDDIKRSWDKHFCC